MKLAKESFEELLSKLNNNSNNHYIYVADNYNIHLTNDCIDYISFQKVHLNKVIEFTKEHNITLVTFNNPISQNATNVVMLKPLYDEDFDVLCKRLRLDSQDVKGLPLYKKRATHISILLNNIRGELNAMYSFCDIFNQPFRNKKFTDMIEGIAGLLEFNSRSSNSFVFNEIPVTFNNFLFTRIYETIKQSTIIVSNNKFKCDYYPMSACIKTVGNTLLNLNVGFGGLHSINEPLSIASGKNGFIELLDVTSYYPSLICYNQKLQKVLKNPTFVSKYKELYDLRIKLKHTDPNKAKALKYILNAVTGKFKDVHSQFYNPQAYLQMTLTGQLLLLKLIDMLMNRHITIINANTDGLTILNSDNRAVTEVVSEWERMFDLSIERKLYKFLTMDNVNNYMLIDMENNTKGIGSYTFDFCTSKNCNDIVIAKALKEYFVNDIDPIEYISELNDKYFININTSDKVISYVRSIRSDLPLKSNGKKLPKSDNCEIVKDGDYEWCDYIDRDYYIKEVKKKIHRIADLVNKNTDVDIKTFDEEENASLDIEW